MSRHVRGFKAHNHSISTKIRGGSGRCLAAAVDSLPVQQTPDNDVRLCRAKWPRLEHAPGVPGDNEVEFEPGDDFPAVPTTTTGADTRTGSGPTGCRVRKRRIYQEFSL